MGCSENLTHWNFYKGAHSYSMNAQLVTSRLYVKLPICLERVLQTANANDDMDVSNPITQTVKYDLPRFMVGYIK